MCNYVVLDLEMCRVFNNTDLRNEIIQIGAVCLDENYNIIDSFMRYVSPKYGFIDKEIRRLTGITNKDIKNKDSIDKVLKEFFDWYPKDSIFVTWSDSDEIQIKLETSFKNINIEQLDNIEWIDCQKMFSKRIQNERQYALSEALKISNIFLDEREHDALADAINTAGLYKKLVTEKEFNVNKYYYNEYEIERSTYNPFEDLLKNYKVV